MRVKRGLAQVVERSFWEREVREIEARTPDHYVGCLVAQLGVIIGTSKQATGSKRTLVYTIWPSSTIGPQRPNDTPRCTLVLIRVAKFHPFPYNTPSRFLRPTGVRPEFPLRCP